MLLGKQLEIGGTLSPLPEMWVVGNCPFDLQPPPSTLYQSDDSISFMQLNSANISGISFDCTTFDSAQLDELYYSLVVYDTITSTISALEDIPTVSLEENRLGPCKPCGWAKEHNILNSCSYLD